MIRLSSIVVTRLSTIMTRLSGVIARLSTLIMARLSSSLPLINRG